jgi:hypothetical protein
MKKVVALTSAPFQIRLAAAMVAKGLAEVLHGVVLIRLLPARME